MQLDLKILPRTEQLRNSCSHYFYYLCKNVPHALYCNVVIVNFTNAFVYWLNSASECTQDGNIKFLNSQANEPDGLKKA